MKIVSWNVNSIRVRTHLMSQLISEEQPDIICLQETKVVDEDFPHSFFSDLGYKYIFVYGSASYNGVAIISKVKAKKLGSLSFGFLSQKRHLAIKLENGIEIHNIYIPAGGDDPVLYTNHKFVGKLFFLEQLTNYFFTRRDTPKIICGDFNVARSRYDVWSHSQLLDVVSYTSIEKLYLNNLISSVSLIDVHRYFLGDNVQIYSWWSYRSPNWSVANRGRRLDYIMASQELKDSLSDAYITKKFRGLDRPSDHVPLFLITK